MISVIIIFFNEERFLRDAIESVLAQTYQNWELLLVDDGSTDGSTAIAAGYAAMYPERLRCLEHPGHQNRGMSRSRNLGIAQAQGEYLAFLDADDAWEPRTLEEQIALLESHPEVGMVYGAMQWWYSWTGDPADRNRDVVQNLGVQPDRVVFPPNLLPVFITNEGATPSGNLFRCQTLLAVGGFEEQFEGMYEDQALRVKVCLKFPAYVSGRVWYKWRKHDTSCCSVAVRNGQHRLARAKFLDWVEGYFRQEGVQDAKLWRTLREALWPYRHPILARLQQNMDRSAQRGSEFAKRVARRIMPVSARRWLRTQWQGW